MQRRYSEFRAFHNQILKCCASYCSAKPTVDHTDHRNTTDTTSQTSSPKKIIQRDAELLRVLHKILLKFPSRTIDSKRPGVVSDRLSRLGCFMRDMVRVSAYAKYEGGGQNVIQSSTSINDEPATGEVIQVSMPFVDCWRPQRPPASAMRTKITELLAAFLGSGNSGQPGNSESAAGAVASCNTQEA
jgi:hypothetical protein